MPTPVLPVDYRGQSITARGAVDLGKRGQVTSDPRTVPADWFVDAD